MRRTHAGLAPTRALDVDSRFRTLVTSMGNMEEVEDTVTDLALGMISHLELL